MIRGDHRYLICVNEDNQEKTNWLLSKWFDVEFYQISEYIFGVNEYGTDRLETYLNQNGNDFTIVHIFNISGFAKIFLGNTEATFRYNQFIYLTEPLPKKAVLSNAETNKVIDQLLDKINYFSKVGDPLTYDENHFLRAMRWR